MLPHSSLGSPYLHSRAASIEKPHFLPTQHSYGHEMLQSDFPQMCLIQRQPVTDLRASPLLYKSRQELDLLHPSPYTGLTSDVSHPNHSIFDQSNIGSPPMSAHPSTNITYTPPLPRTSSRLSSSFKHRQSAAHTLNVSNTSNSSLGQGPEDERLGRPFHSTSTPH